MNHRDDDLIKLAFGELDGADASNISQDSQAASQMDDYRWIKDGLTDLRIVPPMQYSTERLRDAILGEGLNLRKRNPLARLLAWTPAGAFGVAAAITAIILVRSGPETILAPEQKPEPLLTQVAMRMEDIDRPVLTERAFRTMDDELLTISEFEGEPAVAPTSSDIVPRAKAPTRAVRQMNIGPRVMPTVDASKKIEAQAREASAEFSHEAIPASDATTSPDEAPAIVIIGSDDDARTGAPIATEVRFDANVVVGG